MLIYRLLIEYDNYSHQSNDPTNDNRGNITAIKTYAYSSSSSDPSGVALTETRITYDSTGWKDQIDYIEYYISGTLIRTEDYTYDSIGNIIDIESTVDKSFEWEGRRLTSYTIGTTTYDYTYNDQGVRVSKTFDGITTEYFVDGYNVLAEKTGNMVIYYTYDADNSLISMNYLNNEYFYIKNMQGDIIRMVDKDGETVAEYRYDAWGNIVYRSGLVSDINPYRYRGYRFDLETGLYYLNSRYYDSSIGRFISADSINYLNPSSSSGLNLYAYCESNPVMNIDRDGHSWESFWNGVGNWWDDNWDIVAGVALTVTFAAVSISTFGLGAVAIGMVVGGMIGTGFGALSAAMNGDDIGYGALSGLIGGVLGGLGGGFGVLSAGMGVATLSLIGDRVNGRKRDFGRAATAGITAGIFAGFANGYLNHVNKGINEISVKIINEIVGGIIFSGHNFVTDTVIEEFRRYKWRT